MKGRIHLIGLGLEPRDHASVESLVALGDCARVYASGLERADLAALRPFCRRGALKILPEGAGAKARGRRLAAEAAGGREIALCTLGHPFYAGELGAAVAAAAAARGVECVPYGAVSPMGVALSAAGVTLGTSIWGMQSFEHRAFVERAPEPNRAWPTVIYFLSGPDAASVKACAARLRGLFPAAAELRWCSGALAGRVETLDGLARRAAAVRRRWVLYLAPTARASTGLGRTETHQIAGRGPLIPEWVRK
jgi:Tetrapyrrole (Corrin/Porphyrin) Methylases